MTMTGREPTPTESPKKGDTGAGQRGAGAWVRAALSAVGLDREQSVPASPGTADRGTVLAERRTNLALERSYQAVERTLMAWIRTALAMISFGFTIGKLAQVVEGGEVKGFFGRTIGVDSIAYFLVILGTSALVLAILQHYARFRELRKMGLPRRWSVASVVGILLSMLGAFAITSLVLKL